MQHATVVLSILGIKFWLMNNAQHKVVVVGGKRTPFTKSFGHYARISNQELLIQALDGVAKAYGLEGKTVGDVALGAVVKSSLDWNMAREAVLGSVLHPTQQAYDVQRACGTSLETVNQIALKIATGQIDSGIAGGVDSNSDLPVMAKQSLAWKLIDLNQAKTFGQRLSRMLAFRPSDFKPQLFSVLEPRTGKSMGQHTELTVKNWQITREAQDELAMVSHHNAAKAYEEGFFEDLVLEYRGLKADTFVRATTSMEKLAKLPPVFDRSAAGTLTAGNSTPLTDGAAAVLLASEDHAKAQGWPILAYVKDVTTAAVDFVAGEDLLIAPAKAVADLLKRNQLTFADIDYFEIHEAFAGQVLATLKAWEDEEYSRNRLGWDGALGSIDRSKLNVAGGSLALGHPFAATGARIVAQAAKMLKTKGGKRALISVCTAGGMGVAAILERADD